MRINLGFLIRIETSTKKILNQSWTWIRMHSQISGSALTRRMWIRRINNANKWIIRTVARATTNTVEITELGKFFLNKNYFHKLIKWHLRYMWRERSSRKLLNFFLFGVPRLPVCLSGSGVPIGLCWRVLMWCRDSKWRGGLAKSEIILAYCILH